MKLLFHYFSVFEYQRLHIIIIALSATGSSRLTAAAIIFYVLLSLLFYCLKRDFLCDHNIIFFFIAFAALCGIVVW